MRHRLHTQFLPIAGACALALFAARPAQSDQIVALKDDNGRTVYVNTGEMPARTNWVKRSFHPQHTRGSAVSPQEVNHIVRETADRYRVDPELVRAIIQVESEFNPNAISSKGAMGLMQLIPSTAQRLGVENPFDPQQNVEGGIKHLKYLLEAFGGNLPLSLAAYNAGEVPVRRKGGIPAFQETRQYVRKVTNLYMTGVPESSWTKSGPRQPDTIPIIRYVDEHGVLHYTNVY